MRRMCLSLLCAVAVPFAIPQQAEAWWEYIEAFSGPQFGLGWDIEMRLVCFTDPDPAVLRKAATKGEQLRERRADFQMAFENLQREARELLKKEPVGRMLPLLSQWQLAVDAYHKELASVSMPVRNNETRLAFENALSSARSAEAMAFEQDARLGAAVRALQSVPPAALTPEQRLTMVQPFAAAVGQLTSASQSLLAAGAIQQDALTAPDVAIQFVPPAVGLFFSACSVPKDRVRKGSIDIGFHYSWATATKDFAGNQDVTLIMLTPSYSWRLSSFLDAGTGGGVYWFSSTGVAEGVTPPEGDEPSPGLSPFRGIMLEPVRLDLHLNRSTDNGWKAFFSGFLLRLGTYWFPAGFDMNAFGNNRRKPGEIQKRIGVFYDLSIIREYCADNMRSKLKRCALFQ